MADDASTATAASDRDLDARLQQALHQYFATPRMLAQGDLVVLSLPSPASVPRRWSTRPRAADIVYLQVAACFAPVSHGIHNYRWWFQGAATAWHRSVGRV